jgi:hypothetical protein
MSLVRAGVVTLLCALALGCKPKPAPAPTASEPAPRPAPGSGPVARVQMLVTEEGYVPSHVPARVGQPLILSITRKTDRTCAREITFVGQPGKTELPLGKTVEVTYTPKAAGELKFGCAMGMMVAGVLTVTD